MKELFELIAYYLLLVDEARQREKDSQTPYYKGWYNGQAESYQIAADELSKVLVKMQRDN